MKIIFMALLAVATLTSCELDKSEELTITPQPEVENFDDVYALGWTPLDGQSARLTLDFNVSETTTTRSTGTAMERSVDDVNLYFFNDAMGIEQHIFVGSTTTITLPITPGEWAIYAVANIGSNMGDKSHDEVKGYSYDIVLESDLTYKESLIMSYSGSAEISEIESLNILFTRALSRVDLKVSLTGDAVSKVMLDRLRMVNMPKRSYLFDDSGAAPASSDLMTYDYRDCGDGSTFLFYMLENLSGTNSAITSESQKTADNAPSTAAYVEIEAETATSWVTYRIYLGENNTDDFNVRRNNIYDMEISIYSADASDFRTTVRYFPIDVRVETTYAHVDVTKYRISGELLAFSRDCDITVKVKIDQAVMYDIYVNFQMLIYYTIEIDGAVIGYAPMGGTYSVDPMVYIPAGSTTGSLSLGNYKSGYFYLDTPTYMRISSVESASTLDENNYILGNDFTCTYTTTTQTI
ncbi:MAG: DUF4906 domain-containing protein [Rikenellaceae bacterium]